MNFRFNKNSSKSGNSSSRGGKRPASQRYKKSQDNNQTYYPDRASPRNRKSSRDEKIEDKSRNEFNPKRNSSKDRGRLNSRDSSSNYSSNPIGSEKTNMSFNLSNKDRKYVSQERNNRSSQTHLKSSNSHNRNFDGNKLITDDNSLEDQSLDLLWGRHSTQAAFETGRPIHRIWCTTEIRSSSRFFQFLRDAKSSGVLVEEVSWARLGQITKGAVHQGIALQTAATQTIDLKKLIHACSSLKESALLIALDGITDPHNLGAIIRSAEALGAHGLVLPQRRSAGLTGSVAKVAAGALEHLPVARVVNLNRSLNELKDCGYKVIGLAEEGESPLQEISFDSPLVVVIGSEGKGLSVLTRKHCDHLVRIPLRGITTSLNASIATSIVLYEIAKNTWMKGISGQSPSPQLQRAKFF